MKHLIAALLAVFTIITAFAQEPAITWHELDTIYNVKSTYTDLQKEAAWPRYKGKSVAWTGKVSSVSEGWLGGLTLQVKMNRSTFTSDVIVSLKDSEKPKAMTLHEGDLVHFSAVLDDWGTLLPMSLSDGEIK